MFYYKNLSSSAKTFHGVTFEPGEIKQVNKYINNRWMILVEKETFEKQNTQQKHSSEKPKNPVPEQKPVGNKEEQKVEEKVVPKPEPNNTPKKEQQKEESPKQEEKKDAKPESDGQKS